METWTIFIIALLAASASAQNSSSSSMFGEIPQGNYNASSAETANSGSLKTLFDMAQGFVNVVFKPFSDLADYITTVFAQDNMLEYLGENWQEAAKFEAGFIACLVFGVLFLILVPLVGSIMCCCRCCGNCGGQFKQSNKRSKSCWRQCYCVTMLLLTVLMTIPTVFVFLTNEWVTDVVDTGPNQINAVLGDVSEYFNVVPRQIEYTTGQYQIVDDNVRPLVSDFGVSVGIPLQKEVEIMAASSLAAMDDAIKAVDDTTAAINAVDASLTVLSTGMVTLDTSLQTLQNNMSLTLNVPDCAGDPYCNAVYISRNQLVVGFDITEVTGLSAELQSVNNSLNSFDVHGMRDNVTQEIADIPKETTEQTQDASNDAIRALDEASQSVSDIESNIPTDSFEQIDQTVTDIQNSITDFFEFYDQNIEKWVYIAGVVLGSILAFICVCYYLGVLLGVCGSETKVSPAERGSTSNCGGIMLMVGVGFTFIFSLIFMLLVIVTFTVGGHGERYGCQGLDAPNYEALAVVEDVAELNLSQILKLPPDVPLSLSEILNSCEDDASVYTAFKLEHIYNVTSLLDNVTQKTNDLDANVDKVIEDIDLNSIKIYSEEDQADLLALKDSGLDNVDFADYLSKLGTTGVTKFNLTVYAKFLRDSAENFTSPATNYKDFVLDYANEVDRIQAEEVVGIQDDYETLETNIKFLTQQPAVVNSTIDILDDALGGFNGTFHTTGKDIITTIVGNITNQVTGNVTAYTDWAGDQIVNNVGACKTVYDSYTATVAVFCDYLIDTINGLWFSLGWCCFFLIPSAIVAMKLMKFYRRMNYDDGLDERREYSFLG